MTLQLDYQKITQTMLALEALRAIRSGADRVIGQYEQSALLHLLRDAFADCALTLIPYIDELDPANASLDISLVGSATPSLALHDLEQAIAATASARLVNPTAPAVAPQRLRRALRGLPAGITPA